MHPKPDPLDELEAAWEADSDETLTTTSRPNDPQRGVRRSAELLKAAQVYFPILLARLRAAEAVCEERRNDHHPCERTPTRRSIYRVITSGNLCWHGGKPILAKDCRTLTAVAKWQEVRDV